MSIDRTIYYGHYFLVKEITVNHTKEADGCPKCLKGMTCKFCPECGTACGDIEIVEQYAADMDDILDELDNDHLDRSYREFIRETRFKHKGRIVCILNYTNFYKGQGGFLDKHEFFLPSLEIPELNSTGQYRVNEFLKAYRERFGDDSIEVDIGLLQYEW